MTDNTRTWRDVREDAIQRNEPLRAEYDARGALHTFVAAMIAARTRRGWSQRQLAEAIGVSQPVIGRLESGARDPRLSTMVAVCAALELPLTVGEDHLRLAG